jgi:hypothetical protein
VKKGGENVALKHQQAHSNFINQSVQEGRPANLVMVLDTHSDAFTGQLQAAGGSTGVTISLTLPDLVRGYVGDGTLQDMMNASGVARSHSFPVEISPGVAPWADITPKARGGWRVMVMVSCGSAVKIPAHWEYLTQLLRK